MTDTTAVARKWGDSIAIIIPREIAKAENIHVNDHVLFSVKKGVDLSRFFGCLKINKTAQELKDEGRKGWE